MSALAIINVVEILAQCRPVGAISAMTTGERLEIEMRKLAGATPGADRWTLEQLTGGLASIGEEHIPQSVFVIQILGGKIESGQVTQIDEDSR